MTIEYTREQAVERMEAIHGRVEELSQKHRTSKADDNEFGELRAEFQDLEDHVNRLDRREAIARAAGEGGGGFRVERGMNPYAETRTDRPHGGLRDAAMRQLERSVKAGLPARAAETVQRLTETGSEVEQSWASRWVTDTGADSYKSAFAKLVAFGEARAGLEWTAAERAAYDRVSRLKSEQRALSLSDSAGGFLVPFEIDPSVMIQNAGCTNSLLQISRVVASISDVWHGVSSAGVTASWDAEAS